MTECTPAPGASFRAPARRARALAGCAGLVGLLLLASAQPASAERYRRQFNWSGHTWKVRVAERENPGRNAWGDSKQNVRVRSDGSLLLGITTGPKWRSVEIAGTRSLGYGHYRWVVDTDLSNPAHVFALFVRDMAVSSASHGEQDIEFSRWGAPTLHPGWIVSWSKTRRAYSSFPMTNRAPYVMEISWRRRSVRFHMTDADRTVLIDRTVRAGSTGKQLFPRMSHWLLPDSSREHAPAPVIVNSFRFTKH
jgi:hypothetical protein